MVAVSGAAPGPTDVAARPAPGGLRYKVITGTGDEFARAVSRALDEGYELQGPPALGLDADQQTVLAQAVVWPG